MLLMPNIPAGAWLRLEGRDEEDVVGRPQPDLDAGWTPDVQLT